MRRWWLVLALLLSLGINVGILAVLAIHRLRPPQPPQPLAPVAAAGVERLADHLGLEGAERRRFVELQREFFDATRQRRERMVRLRRELARELTSRSPDRRRVEEILAELAGTYAEVEGAFAHLVLDSREVLDPRQQRQYLRFLGRLRAGAEGMRPGPGPGRRLRPDGLSPRNHPPASEEGEPGAAARP